MEGRLKCELTIMRSMVDGCLLFTMLLNERSINHRKKSLEDLARK